MCSHALRQKVCVSKEELRDLLEMKAFFFKHVVWVIILAVALIVVNTKGSLDPTTIEFYGGIVQAVVVELFLHLTIRNPIVKNKH